MRPQRLVVRSRHSLRLLESMIWGQEEGKSKAEDLRWDIDKFREKYPPFVILWFNPSMEML